MEKPYSSNFEVQSSKNPVAKPTSSYDEKLDKLQNS